MAVLETSRPVYLTDSTGVVVTPGTSDATAANQVISNAHFTTIEGLVGEVQTSPTSNTALDRLKAIKTSVDTRVAAVETLIGEVQASPTSNSALDRLKAIKTSVDTRVAAVETLIGEVQASPTSNTVLDRLKAIKTSVDALLTTTTGYTASATFTPAATSHVANDCNGAAGTFALGAVSASNVLITGAAILINSATAEATAWRLYLYNVTPPSATADDGAWDLASGDQASFLGYVDLYTAIDLGSTQWNEVTGLSKQIKLSGTSVFGYLVNNTTLTPAAVAHTVTLNVTQL